MHPPFSDVTVHGASVMFIHALCMKTSRRSSDCIRCLPIVVTVRVILGGRQTQLCCSF